MMKFVEYEQGKWSLICDGLARDGLGAVVTPLDRNSIESFDISERDKFLALLVWQEIESRNWRGVGRYKKYGAEVCPHKNLTLLMEQLADVDFDYAGVDFVREDFERILIDYKKVILDFFEEIESNG